jgi:predicted transcriptional regulator
MDSQHASHHGPHADPSPSPPGSDPGPATSATSSSSHSAPERTTLLQQAFLLEQLATPGVGPLTGGELNKKIGKTAERELGLKATVANEMRSQLKEKGYLATRKNGKKVLFELTDTGRAYLTTLERPTVSARSKQPPPVDETSISDEVRNAQKAFLLLQLLDADDRRLSKGEANAAITDELRTSLSLNPVSANYRRGKLAEQGYIRISKAGRSEEYSLTSDGLDYLAATTTHLTHARITIHGRTLNALVAAAQERSFERDGTAAPSEAERPVPTQAELADGVLAVFQELRRERYARSGLVPIHEVRARVAERFGSAAARHDLLDDVIQELWRQRRIGLEAISDLAGATQEQLNDSIPGVGNTTFYLEAPREQPLAESLQ